MIFTVPSPIRCWRRVRVEGMEFYLLQITFLVSHTFHFRYSQVIGLEVVEWVGARGGGSAGEGVGV